MGSLGFLIEAHQDTGELLNDMGAFQVAFEVFLFICGRNAASAAGIDVVACSGIGIAVAGIRVTGCGVLSKSRQS